MQRKRGVCNYKWHEDIRTGCSSQQHEGIGFQLRQINKQNEKVKNEF